MNLLRSQIGSKMASLRQRLEEIREYKRILIEDGIKPDAEDKLLESELIQKLLGLEKDLARMDAAKGRRRQDEAKKKAPTKKTSRGMLDGVKKDLSKVKAKASDSDHGSREGSRSRFRTKKNSTESLTGSKASALRTEGRQSKNPQTKWPKIEGRQSNDPQKKGPKLGGRQTKMQPQDKRPKKLVKTNRRQPQKRF